MRPISIAGIDPGTTSAYALIDENGGLITVDSGKDFTVNKIISIMTNISDIIAVGTDKRTIPSSIEKFSASIGCTIVSPLRDLSALDKRRITKKYKTSNDHEIDAIASALLALREFRPLLKKIREAVKEKDVVDKHYEVAKQVIFKEINIDEAIRNVKPIPNKISVQITRPSKEVPEKLLISRLGKEIHILQDSNSKYKKLLKKTNKELTKKEKIRNDYYDSRRDSSYLIEIKKKNAEIEALCLENATLKKLVNDSIDYISIPKIKTLLWEHFGPRRIEAFKTEAIFVEDPESNSSKTLTEMYGKVGIIISPSNLQIKGFASVKAGNISYHNFGDHIYMRKEDLQKNLESQDLSKIIKDYQLKRKSA